MTPLSDQKLKHNHLPSNYKLSTNSGFRAQARDILDFQKSVSCALLMAYVKCHSDRAH